MKKIGQENVLLCIIVFHFINSVYRYSILTFELSMSRLTHNVLWAREGELGAATSVFS